MCLIKSVALTLQSCIKSILLDAVQHLHQFILTHFPIIIQIVNGKQILIDFLFTPLAADGQADYELLEIDHS